MTCEQCGEELKIGTGYAEEEIQAHNCKQNMASKTKQLTITAEMQKKVDELRNELGYPSETMVYYAAISHFHLKTFPPHTLASRRTPEEAERDKEEQRKKKNEFERSKWLALAEKLGGKVKKTDAGEVVSYYTYGGKKRYLQETPLHLLHEGILVSQYSPDKATVERLQAEKKTDY